MMPAHLLATHRGITTAFLRMFRFGRTLRHEVILPLSGDLFMLQDLLSNDFSQVTHHDRRHAIA